MEGLSALTISVGLASFPPLILVILLFLFLAVILNYQDFLKQGLKMDAPRTLGCVQLFQEKGLLHDSWEPVMYDFLK